MASARMVGCAVAVRSIRLPTATPVRLAPKSNARKVWNCAGTSGGAGSGMPRARRKHPRLQAQQRQRLVVALLDGRVEDGFALVATLTLALGIGATTAVFAVVDAALTELGDPDLLAARYANRPQYLLGPGVFPEWQRLLTLLLPVPGDKGAL